ncbi:hypothetical protein A4R35_16370 [Thermogemmatispora tikiterensis]|uniref:Uncharacterized protein n=1 Tax=Thermogemmatispora tikiterensis TaxID=1825093 RepID=A0A328VSP9_9CHLR|nr:hypothetical protein A4R35_16370 [Thermogemmatispora tikiterensis]
MGPGQPGLAPAQPNLHLLPGPLFLTLTPPADPCSLDRPLASGMLAEGRLRLDDTLPIALRALCLVSDHRRSDQQPIAGRGQAACADQPGCYLLAQPCRSDHNAVPLVSLRQPGIGCCLPFMPAPLRLLMPELATTERA